MSEFSGAAGAEKLTAYEAKKALLSHKRRERVKEGFLHRTYRLIKELIGLDRELASAPLISDEQKREERMRIVRDCWAPVYGGLTGFIDSAWSYITELGADAWDLVLMAAEAIVTALYYGRSALIWILDVFYDIRLIAEEKKEKLFQIFAGLVCAGAVGAVVVSSLTGYEYSYYGRTLGIARDRNDVYQTISVLGDRLSEATGANVSLDVERDIEFRRVFGLHLDTQSKDDILSTLTYMKDIQVKAFAINIDGEDTVIMEDEAAARALLQSVMSDYTAAASGVEYQDAHFEEGITISEVNVLLGDIWNADSARRYLETGSTKQTPAATDSPKLTVATTELATYYEEIPYGTRYIDNAGLYLDETELISEGKNGETQYVARIERINGEEVSRTIVSSTRVSSPVDEIMYRGTKPLPAREGTGVFDYPLRSYTITSRFGMRWGSMHTGVDLAAPMGTKIYAADGGVVTYAGSKGTYGLLVIIDHGSLYETYYAHCSQLLVSVGDQVYKGQNIALVGSTGQSTGPHCHFEVRYKGEPHNPLDFL